MLVSRRYLISGRVQGVGFRFFAEEAARREGISGFVRNLADARVEVVAEGERDAVERFELAVRRGPRGARIDAVDVEDQMPHGRVLGFSIRG